MRSKIIVILYFLTLCISLAAQEDKVFIQIMQLDRDGIPSEAKNHLVTKMKQLISSNGIADEDPHNRFVITAKALVKTKDIIAGPPQKVSINVEFVFFIGDVVENKVFENFSISAMGVGNNETKAYISAINSVKPKNKEMVEFLAKAKKKIVDYYYLRCAEIKAKAKQKASANDYPSAIYELMQIPNVCDCSHECQELAIQYNKEYTINTAAKLLNEAKAIWASNPNAEGASKVMRIVRQIQANSPNQKELDNLLADITKKLKNDQEKEWAFQMQKYKDDVEREKKMLEMQAKQQDADNERRARQQVADNAYRSRQQSADNRARQQLIEAYRQVGLAYARRQPSTYYVTYQKNIYTW